MDRYKSQNCSANKSDYKALSGSVMIPAGQITSEIEIEAVADNDVEGDEHVIIHISDSTLYNSNPKNFSVVLIQDNACYCLVRNRSIQF